METTNRDTNDLAFLVGFLAAGGSLAGLFHWVLIGLVLYAAGWLLFLVVKEIINDLSNFEFSDLLVTEPIEAFGYRLTWKIVGGTIIGLPIFIVVALYLANWLSGG